MTNAIIGAAPPGSSRRRLRVVVFATLACGAALLAATIRSDQSTTRFMIAGLALAAVWFTGAAMARSSRLATPTRLGRNAAAGFAIGTVMFAVFVTVAWIARRLDILTDPIDAILRQADARPRILVVLLASVNAGAEELFFRGTMMDAFTHRYAAVATTLIYAIITSAGGNVALVLAAVIMGAVFAAERRWRGTLVTPIVTHITWSVLMITTFPRP